MEIVTVSSQKGGTGKTTTAAALLQAAAHSGLKALAVDLDPQCNLTFALNPAEPIYTGYDLLHGTCTAEQAATPSQAAPIDVICGNWNLSTETSSKGSARRLSAALEPIKENYDLIVIDTPAAGGELQYNALYAATKLVITLQADIYSIHTLYGLNSVTEWLQGKKLKRYCLITKYDKRSTLVKKLHDEIKKAAAELDINYLGSIRQGIAVQEATATQQSLFDYAPNSKPALDYMEAFSALLK